MPVVDVRFERLSDQHLQQLERLSGELVAVLRQAKLRHEPVTAEIQRFQRELGDARRERYDRTTTPYDGY